MVHVIEKKVTYLETTQLKAVYFSTFIQFFGLGIEEYFNALGIPVTEFIDRGMGFAVLECFCKYHSFARCGDMLEIHTDVTEIKRKTFKFKISIYEKYSQKLLADGYTTWLAYGPDKKSMEIPEEVLQAFKTGP